MAYARRACRPSLAGRGCVVNSDRCNPDSPEAQEASRQNERDVFAAQMQATVFDVGTRWPAPGGWCEVARIEDDVAWVRESSHPGTLFRYDVEELPRLREIAAANLAYRERAAAREAEIAAREAEARSLDGWEATLSPMALGRAQAVLMLSVLYRGRPMSRRDVVRLVVSEGAAPGNSEGPTLDWPDGRFLRLPKLAVDYARHLVGNPTP